MNILKPLLFSGLTLASFMTTAAEIPKGTWWQTSSTSTDCGACEINITNITPNIIQINANNTSIGYASYNKKTDSYNGALEWKGEKAESCISELFTITLVYEGKTLTMKASGDKFNFTNTYRAKIIETDVISKKIKNLKGCGAGIKKQHTKLNVS